MDFDHVDDGFLDGCGFDSNAFFPINEEGGVAEHTRSRFAQPKSEAEIDKAHEESIPKKTREDTAYCVRLWETWAESRSLNTGNQVPPLAQMDTRELQYWLSRFIHEARKKDSREYAPITLYHLLCGIMRHIRHNCGRSAIDFFKDPEFSDFRSSLDAEMKRLQSAGMGSVKKQAEPLTLEEEEQLWEKKILSDHSPKALLNTIMFMNGYISLCEVGLSIINCDTIQVRFNL